MSVSLDLLMRMTLDSHLLTLGTGTDNLRTLDLTTTGIAGNTTANLQIVGENPLIDNLMSEKVWIEGALVKTPQDIITASECGLSHKKNMYVVFVKTNKVDGLYYNEAVSALVEHHFPNNKHFKVGDQAITVLKSYQQPTILLNSDTGRYQNRIFVECEIYYENNKK